jgi:glutathione S-transferase
VRLYDYLDSGNGYKVRLLLSHLGASYELVEVDILKGETRTAEFLARNPNGKIPVLETDSGEFLWESNAILFYLADGTRYLPTDALQRARVLQWMGSEQYSHEPNIATSRFWLKHLELDAGRKLMLEIKREAGYEALGVMERHLAGKSFFVGDKYSVADIALYAYTHVAGEGGFDLGPYPEIRDWLQRVAAQPGHVSMASE